MKRILYYLPILALAACTNTTQSDASAVAEEPVELRAHDLPLPTVPDSLSTPTERADYLLTHFWDAMDFKDAKMMGDTLLVEQTFSNYIELLPYMSGDDTRARAIDALLTQASADPESFQMIAETAQKYLHDEESPFRNDTLYAVFAECIAKVQAPN